jgi:hypothetical protein
MERWSPESNGFAGISGVVSKVQVGNVDLTMVAKASL